MSITIYLQITLRFTGIPFSLEQARKAKRAEERAQAEAAKKEQGEGQVADETASTQAAADSSSDDEHNEHDEHEEASGPATTDASTEGTAAGQHEPPADTKAAPPKKPLSERSVLIISLAFKLRQGLNFDWLPSRLPAL